MLPSINKIKKHKPILAKLLNKNYQLIEGTDEIFELDLALWESETLNTNELVARSAYFKTVDGVETSHYKMCHYHNLDEIHKDSSFRTKSFFLNGKYSTGYATHGLFPYRGKFHPQLIRALINILNLKKGDVILDPMAGSGTVAVEANLLGIDAVSIDLSPFCKLMTQVKTFSLELDADTLESALSSATKLFKKLNKSSVPKYFTSDKDELKPYYEVALLAFLDSMGFAVRNNSSAESLFPRVLNRYIKTINFFQTARKKVNLKIGASNILQGNAMSLPIKDNSVNAIITSPPYSFAINYLKNDQPQLEYLGYNLSDLQKDMIGLSPGSVETKLEKYFISMDLAMGEMQRVSKPGSPIVIIIGTNDIQTKGVQLEPKVIEIAKNKGIKFDFEMQKPIRGIQNSMKHETILFFTNHKKVS